MRSLRTELRSHRSDPLSEKRSYQKSCSLSRCPPAHCQTEQSGSRPLRCPLLLSLPGNRFCSCPESRALRTGKYRLCSFRRLPPLYLLLCFPYASTVSVTGSSSAFTITAVPVIVPVIIAAAIIAATVSAIAFFFIVLFSFSKKTMIETKKKRKGDASVVA